MQITRGRKKSAQKVIIYAPEGWGKSTCASKMNNALFMDVEDSTKMLDVARIEDDYSNWQTILDNVDYVISQSPGSCETFVIDTLDWAEQACINSLNKKHHTDDISYHGLRQGLTVCPCRVCQTDKQAECTYRKRGKCCATCSCEYEEAGTPRRDGQL